MELSLDVINAFNTLNIDLDTPLDVARSKYKKLALLHHPDRNPGDSAATQRFQQVRWPPPVCPPPDDAADWFSLADLPEALRTSSWKGSTRQAGSLLLAG